MQIIYLVALILVSFARVHFRVLDLCVQAGEYG
jgi:hypothetical protein